MIVLKCDKVTYKPHLSTRSPTQVFTRSFLEGIDRIPAVSYSLRICGAFFWSSDSSLSVLAGLCSSVLVVACAEEKGHSILPGFIQTGASQIQEIQVFFTFLKVYI